MFEFLTAITIDPHQRTAVGTARLPAGHPQFADHFPGVPLLPGTWTIELMKQVAEPLLEAVALQGLRRVRAALRAVEVAKMERPVPLPAEILLKIWVTSLGLASATAYAEAIHGRGRCGVAEVSFNLEEVVAAVPQRPLVARVAIETALASTKDHSRRAPGHT
jgi:3-hydroxymyristoyl/3-hydroxydecanoyl-(acyl carrier protein) dehydratase